MGLYLGTIPIAGTTATTSLSGKANISLDNVNNSGTATGGKWAMPSNTYEDLTLGASGTDYTAPANGYVVLTRTGSALGQYCQLLCGALAPTAYALGSSGLCSVWIPVLKGQSYRANYNAATAGTFRFIYAKGSEWENV